MTAQIRRPVAVVTGAKQGLGRATALELAKAGFDIVAMDLVEDAAAVETLAEIRETGAGAVFQTADISDVAGHEALVDAAFSAFGAVDCLVNNAGIAARPLTDILDLGTEAFDRNLNINLRGTFFLTQAFARRMIAETDTPHYRSIVIVSSIAASHVSVDRAQYCVSKAALSMVTKLYAVRLAEYGIHVHEVRPGFIRTAMTASAPRGKIDDYIESGAVPLRRWGRDTDIGRSISTLASGALPYLDGQPIYVDGGYHIPTA